MDFKTPRFLPSSLFTDDEAVQRSALLLTLASVYTGFTFIFAAFAAIVQPELAVRTGSAALIAFAITLTCLGLSWRGWTKLGCGLFVTVNLALITARAVMAGGVQAANLMIYFVFALAAGMLLGRRASIATALASILLCLGMALGFDFGIVQRQVALPNALVTWWLYALCMSFVMFMIILQILLMLRARARVEHELANRRRTEAHLNAALRAGAVGIWDGHIGRGRAWTDERTANLFGVTRAEDGTVPFETWLGTIHPEDRCKVSAALQALLLRPNARGRMQYRVLRPNGEVRHVEGTGVVMTAPDGTVVSHVGTVTDITERKRREEEKERSEQERRILEEQLLQAQKREVMGTLAGGIAHDFNNLLAAIQNFAALIEEDAASSPESRQFAGRILAGCGRGKDIVGQILTFARTGVQRQEVLDLAAFLNESAPLLSPAIASSARLNLSPPVRPLWVKGNPGQLLQLIANLCVNAGEALGTKGGEVGVTLIAASRAQMLRLAGAPAAPHIHRIGTVEVSRPYVLLCVKDDGPGMTPEVLRRVFDPFFTTKGRQYGSGLGLAVCQGIVESHCGFCLVESAPGKGTRFSVLLPLAEEAPAALPRADAEKMAGGFERILLVDDDLDVLDSMSVGLRRMGYNVQSFNDPLAALAAVERGPDAWDLVIADRIMPGLYGPELLERIKKIDCRIRTILCSGHAEEGDSGPPPSIDLLLAKPVTAAELTAAVRELLAVTPEFAREARA
ncbi:MAG TPA: ATP-binding protein [Rhizomicrobium sp.]|jgi:PAS domain S-box-containing protein|nr:ATP-binding protein [Rhizomicrobium sp.]